jgi:hypothetical protein
MEYTMNEHLEDWQQGDNSHTTPIQRLIKHQEWLKKLHKEIKDDIFQRNKPEEKEPVGFIELKQYE